GRVRVRLEPPAERLAPRQPAERPHPLLGPPRPLAPEALRQGAVRGEEVVALERRRLVQDLVRGHSRPPGIREREATRQPCLRRAAARAAPARAEGRPGSSPPGGNSRDSARPGLTRGRRSVVVTPHPRGGARPFPSCSPTRTSACSRSS